MMEERHLADITKILKKKNAKRVFVQIPEGLKMDANTIFSYLEKEGFEPIISADPCFGACDIREVDAKNLGADIILHIGHADFGVKTRIPVVYYHLEKDADIISILEKNMEKLRGFEKIGLMTTIQFASLMPKIAEALEKHGKKPISGKNRKSGIYAHVLGCDFTAVDGMDADCFLFIGSGLFHPSGRFSGKRVFSLDVEKGEIYDITDDVRKYAIRRELSVEKAKQAKDFIIYISTKAGQCHADAALAAKRELEKKRKNVIVVSADTLSPEKLMGIKGEVIVNTACPRIKDDSEMFKRTIINIEDVKRI